MGWFSDRGVALGQAVLASSPLLAACASTELEPAPGEGNPADDDEGPIRVVPRSRGR